MIYGIEQTTDSRYPETKIRRFGGKKAALEWAKGGGGFAWDGGARHDIPSQQQNWHHRLRDIYEMPAGWRPPSPSQQREYCRKWEGTSKRVSLADAIASAVRNDGERIEE